MTTTNIKIAGVSFDALAIISQTKADFVAASLDNPFIFAAYEKKIRESLLKQVYEIAVKLTAA